MYKSPIEIFTDMTNPIIKQIQTTQETRLLAVVNEYVRVDKEELIKALNYDRQQYEKGLEDAKRVLQTVCTYRRQVMTRPETEREYRPWCCVRQAECSFQCLYSEVVIPDETI